MTTTREQEQNQRYKQYHVQVTMEILNRGGGAKILGPLIPPILIAFRSAPSKPQRERAWIFNLRTIDIPVKD